MRWQPLRICPEMGDLRERLRLIQPWGPRMSEFWNGDKMLQIQVSPRTFSPTLIVSKSWLGKLPSNTQKGARFQVLLFDAPR